MYMIGQIVFGKQHLQCQVNPVQDNGAFRHTGIQTLDISTAFAGKTLQLYAAFIAADRSRQSDSVYLGAINPH
jgi:hypothetical protein